MAANIGLIKHLKEMAKTMLNFWHCVGNQTAGSNSMSLNALVLSKIQDGRQKGGG